jgi:hypothetical protein
VEVCLREKVCRDRLWTEWERKEEKEEHLKRVVPTGIFADVGCERMSEICQIDGTVSA